jgi:hypothetical protein
MRISAANIELGVGGGEDSVETEEIKVEGPEDEGEGKVRLDRTLVSSWRVKRWPSNTTKKTVRS